ncbi:MAG: hypothetical protein WC833_04995 [Bacteroidales bacterium]|jgi:IS605 OrfB family transposase
MLITRKIEIVVDEQDNELKKSFLKQISEWRYLVRNSANELLSFLYSIDRLQYNKILNDDQKKELGIIGVQGEPMVSTASSVLLLEKMKGKIPLNVSNCLHQEVTKKYRETRNALLKGNASLYTYRNNIPIPFSAQSIRNLHWNEERKSFLFSLFSIPFRIVLGRDKTNHKKVFEDIIAGQQRISNLCLHIDDLKKKHFLHIDIDISVNKKELDKNRYMNAVLSADVPIIAGYNGFEKEIGNKEEFSHRLMQIQAGIKRAKINSRYSAEGKGRKRKNQALGKLLEKEKDYINTRIHTYTKLLVEYAIENRCGTINLINFVYKEKNKKKEPLLLKSWTYCGMRQKLDYKARLNGIDISVIDVES